MRPQITILTDPVLCGRHLLEEPARHLARTVRDFVRPPPQYRRSKYRGHFAVTRSMVEGLKKIGVFSTHNPRTRAGLGKAVVVPCGYAALRQAIKWRRNGVVQRLLAGPNLVDFPSEQPELMCAPEIDTLLVPGSWFRDNFIADSPELAPRVATWPAGVDTTFWSPAAVNDCEKQVLVYEKENKWPHTGAPNYIPEIEKRGYRVQTIVYGRYTQAEYLNVLRRSCLMIGFSTDESQGIAWAEAWSTDVPTLLWNQSKVTYKGRTYRTSSAPYLSADTGLFFTSVDTFHEAFDRWESGRSAFRPRRWVLQHMSDEACARQLCCLAEIPVCADK